MYASINHEREQRKHLTRKSSLTRKFESNMKSVYMNSTQHTYSSMHRLRINVSGRIYEICEELVNKWPETVLGNPSARLKHFDYLREEYFFDRNGEAFEGILFFYQTNGYIKCPMFVLMEIFHDECRFFGLLDSLVDESMCDANFLSFIKEQDKNFVRLPRKNGLVHMIEPKSKIKKFFWLLINRPNDSLLGRSFGLACFLCVVASVFLLCYETYVDSQDKPKIIRFKHFGKDLELNAKIICKSQALRDGLGQVYSQVKEACKVYNERKLIFIVFEIICNSFFTSELIIRFLAIRKFHLFFKNSSNLIDLVIILPFWIDLCITLVVDDEESKQSGLSVLKLLRVSRVFRILKLSSHLSILKLIGKILIQCVPDVLLLMTFLLSNLVLFSSFIYYIELFMLEEKSPFVSIPDAFWWAIISFTSIGYGDLIPISNVGKFFGSLFVLCGILIAFLPVPILSAKFEKIYKEIGKLNRIKK